MLTSRILFSCLAIFLASFSACSGEVVFLNDKSFEHLTQASTGMTTGSWLLFFKASKCPHCRKLQPIFERLSEDEELIDRGVVLGTVDITDSPITANRFVIRGFPTLILLHKKKLYRYSGKRNFEFIKEFIIDIDSIDGEAIPSPPSQLDAYFKTVQAVCLELYDAARGNAGATGYAILLMVSMLFTMFAYIGSMFFMPAKKVKSV